MQNSKSVFSSKTILGIFLLLIPIVKQFLGIDLSQIEITNLFKNVDVIVNASIAVLGTILSIYGRFSAKHTLYIKK